MQLTKNFHLQEFTRTQHRDLISDNVRYSQQPEVLFNLQRLTGQVLQPVRSELGPIVIFSGVRMPLLNERVGGATDSAHKYGRAGDVGIIGYSLTDAMKFLSESKIPFDKVILEFGEWLHIQVRREGAPARRQLLRADRVGGETLYSWWKA